MSMFIFEKYYAGAFDRLVLQLGKKLGNLEEAEDRVQDVFLRLSTRKDFCEDLIAKGEFDKYVQGAINKQPAQVYREQYQQVPTVSLDADNIDFLSSIRANHSNCEMGEIELNDFYEKAIELLEDKRKLSAGRGFETAGEQRQYIFIQYCRNGRTFEEIGGVIGCSHQNIEQRYATILTILTPLLEKYLGRKVNGPEKG